MTYTLIVGVMFAVGCGLDGSDIVQIRNVSTPGYTTFETCQAEGKQTHRGFRCKGETE